VGRSVFINSDIMSGYTFSENHPFKPQRIREVYQMCKKKHLLEGPGVKVIDVNEAEEEILSHFHTYEYVENLKKANSGENVDVEMLRHGIGSHENPVFKGVYDFSALTATASLVAAREVAGDEDCAFNPGGGFHHAHPDRAAGFCYVNDVVIAIDEISKTHDRIAYVDIDAHHGDAVQDAYYSNPDVLTISMHETGKTLFPWGGFEKETGEGKGKGRNINLPLEPETDDEVFLLLFENVVMEALKLFDPDIIVGQFGADMLATDPLTHLKLTNNGYIEAIEMLHQRYKKILALGGGGYSMGDVVKCWTMLWSELCGVELNAGYGGALGGVLLGDPAIEDSDLRDMHSYTSGPVKDKLLERANELINNFEKNIKSLLR
jgi:acetoin utilization protein AcuC